MTTFFSKCTAIAVLAGTLMAALSAARADIKDYEFRLVESEIKQGNSAIVAVRLVDKRSGKVIPDAIIIATRIDMAPDGMPTMTTPIEALPSSQPGVYRFKANLMMAGGWQLSLAAKIQGENGTLQNKLVLKATP